MNIALCYETVLPARGGCETYIASLARRLVADGHDVHLYACHWDKSALPSAMHIHQVQVAHRPRFLRPWRFSSACQRAMRSQSHDVTVGFDKILGVDVVYPQGGLHIATAEHNLLKYQSRWTRWLVRAVKSIDPAHRSFALLERTMYLGKRKPLIVAISEMVYRHFQEYYQVSAADLRLVKLAPSKDRFEEFDRPRRRIEQREQWGITPDTTVALFAGLNYRLKGLEPLLHAMQSFTGDLSFQLVVAGSPRTGEFERLARRLGVDRQVRFVGYCSDMRSCYFGTDFLVHPTFYDPCSNVVLEAMACGLPVVTTSYNGASEMLTPPHNGIVVGDPHDHVQLAWAIRQMLDPVRRAECGQAARAAALGWTFEDHYRELLAVFTEANQRKQAA